MGNAPPIQSSLHEAPKRAVSSASLSAPMCVGATQSGVWSWLEKSRSGAAAQFVLPIEAATGVPPHELRPDIYPAPADLNSDLSAHNLETGHGMDR